MNHRQGILGDDARKRLTVH